MPLEKIEQISKDRILGYWKVTESLESLLSKINPAIDPIIHLEEIKAHNKQLEWITARVLCKKLVSFYNLEYHGIGKNINGKPFFNQYSLELSITHSYPYVAIIIDKNLPVGIDLEKPTEKLKKIAQKFLSSAELENAQNDVKKLCILWSAKESLYKIYAKRGLTFKKHLVIDPFKLEESGTITGTIALDDWKKSYNLHYRVENEFVLVFNTN